MSDDPPGWTEADSEQFLALGRIVTPSRDEQFSLLSTLVPAELDDGFRIVEPGCGDGSLATALLGRFARATYLGLDGSPTMLRAAAEHLSRFGERVALRSFRLEDSDAWRMELADPTRCVVSSLVVHHLPDAEKRALFRTIYQYLEPGGALLLIDIVLPTNSRAGAALGANWDRIVRDQSMALTGSLDVYRRFRDRGWNCYTDLDDIDHPTSLFSQLKWLEAAGFRDVDCFWQRGGHALFGGYK